MADMPEFGYGSPSIVILGALLGLAHSWLRLSTGVGFLRVFIAPAHLPWLSRGAAAIITIFGLICRVTLLA